MAYKTGLHLTFSKVSVDTMHGAADVGGYKEWLEYDSFRSLWGLRPSQFHPEKICFLFLLHVPRRSSKKVSCVVCHSPPPRPMSFLISPNLRFPQKLQYALVFYQKCRSFWFPESTPCLLRELFQTVTKLSQQLQTPNCLCPLSLGLLPPALWSFIFSSPHSVFSLMCASCLHLSFHINLLQI